MIFLVDRSHGKRICSLDAADFKVLQEILVVESDQDYDYYLTDATLELLSQAGMSEAAIEVLSSSMRDRGLDLGWEYSSLDDAAEVYEGVVLDSKECGQGGIRVDLLDGSSLVAWSYTDVDGVYKLASAKEVARPSLRLSGRGDLVLLSVPVDGPGASEVFEIQTLSGVMVAADDEPLAGLNVALTDWKTATGKTSETWVSLGGSSTWGDTDSQGVFTIPVLLPVDAGPLEVELEVTTVDGQTLEKIVRTISPGEGFDLGLQRAPFPAEGQLPVMPMDPLLLRGTDPDAALAVD